MAAAWYAGIGARETPHDVLRVMEGYAEQLAHLGLGLRSGGSPGADQAFERGCDLGSGRKDIFLPWRGFQHRRDAKVIDPPAPEAVALARRFHPHFEALDGRARRLIIRDGYQVLGALLDDPVVFVLCWTRNASGEGGTGQAIRIAHAYGI